ncbi:glycoside hydrolase family 115 protein [Zopfia rhizophila CBS 207.26]|uniref:Glycoside hydrolase family 115 protein n=1 Tax=Zopfia rhizophila CBS 207.26 TaxID=1314779 RepID=A0A6A6DC58_9PEZI|nr:glycoside hydrolase family 115 protein [Zopfia rhizophila CBS 207.26]
MGKVSQFVIRFLALASLLLGLVSAIGQKATIAFNGSTDSLLLASRDSHVNLILDAADWPGVLRAANDLAVDFGRVTGLNGTVTATGDGTANASMIFNVTGIPKDWSVAGFKPTNNAGTIIAGTIGNSSIIDELIDSEKIDVSKIEGKWEAFISVVVENPTDDIEEALVIVGSDRRGTIFGLYDISEQIGVSPWYWWADVAPKSHDKIYAIESMKVQKSPTVKYRGFFINDEAPALTGWANDRYPKSQWNSPFNAEFYSHVFELLLRSRANYLWPAMWNGMFNVDDPRNQPLADEYAIVMGTSHTEPMVRATQEWNRFGKGLWQWTENNASIYPFFKEGVERAKPYENVVTVGMRGSHDTAMSPDVQTEVLQNIVDTQQKIMDEVYGNATKVPQMWCLYKEVQDYFEAGMKVPDHVTLLWTEDNWGNIRRLPVGDETKRSGGAGVYYHFDYVGDPRDYKWINNIQLQKTREQMYQAVLRQATQIWIVNVGDIKPYEIPISHFFDLAYDIDLWDEKSIPRWLEQWSARQFDETLAKDIAMVIDKYSFLAAIRKYELIEPNSFSVTNYEEADKLLAQWQNLANTTQALYDKLPAAQQPAFFEMILHPVLAGGNFVDIQVSSAKNQIYAGQGRNSANVLFQRVLDGTKKDHELTQRYNKLLNGKWDHMMDQTHLGYQGYWQQPMRQATPALQWVMNLERSLAGDMGVAVERSNGTVPGDDKWHDNGGNNINLPPHTPFSPPRWIEIFSVGTQPFSWKISAEPFVKLTKTSGTIAPNDPDVRVYVDIDWSKAPAGTGKRTVLNISSSTDYGTQYGMPTVTLPLNNTVLPASFTAGFVEGSAELAFEAEHYTRLIPRGNLTYQHLPGYGRTLSALTLDNPLAPSLTSATAPVLEYDFYTFTPTTTAKGLNLTLILAPTLNTNPKRPLAYIAQIDNKAEQRRQYVIDQPQPKFPVGWEKAVADSAWHNTTNWGAVDTGKHTLKLWLVEPGVVLQKVVIDLGGVVSSHNGPVESYRVGGNSTNSTMVRRWGGARLL